MSGLEVVGGISAVIGIIDASIKIYDSARKDLTLRAEDHLEPINGALPVDVCEALEKILDACDEKAGKLRQIFEKVLPGENDAWEKRYLKVIQRLGKGNKVEELMISNTEDVQLVVNHHAVASAKPEQYAELEKIVQEMKSVEPSIPEEESSSMTFNSGGGNMENYLNQDRGSLVASRERVQTQHFGNGKN